MREDFPSLYEVNTRHLLAERSKALGRPATLDDLGDDWVEGVARLGFDFVWTLGIWTTGPAGREVSRSQPGWRPDFEAALPDLTDRDIVGSPFAIRSYSVHPDFGGEAALEGLRGRLRRRGIALILDFVPNHVALDHPWVRDRPEFLVQGTEEDLRRAPANFIRLESKGGEPRIFAHGRDPYFPGWPDTVQLDYRSNGLRAAMAETLVEIAGRCDGVRCDMAMLVLPEVFSRTWEGSPPPADPSDDRSFWRTAIGGVKAVHPDFLFMAEAYWGLEWSLIGEGFDDTYDKTLYDRLREGDPRSIRGHLHADPSFQARSVRFLENHDEPRTTEVFPADQHRAAAVVTYLVPGLRFLHEGQIEGRRRRASIHLGRRLEEPTDVGLRAFYEGLLAVVNRPEIRAGTFELVGCNPAWEGNPTSERFLAFLWKGKTPDRNPTLVVVNYSPTWSQCYARIFLDDLSRRSLRFVDLLGGAAYDRDGFDLAARGLYLDMPPWGYHAFEIQGGSPGA